MTITVTMVLDRETAGALKYNELLPGGRTAQYPNSPGAKIGVQYIRKVAFPDGDFPTKIRIVVERVTDDTREMPVKEGTSGQLG